MSIKYIVKSEFKYNGKTFKVGEEWSPEGFKFDEQIIASGQHVYTQDERVETRRDRVLKLKARETKLDKDEKTKAVVGLRDQGLSWDTVAEMTGVSVSTARRYYEREKENKDGQSNSSRRTGQSSRRKASGSKK